MSKITLDINEKSIPIVLNILNNLKAGLIENITVNKSLGDKTGKYLSKNKYKKNLSSRNILEDEFIDNKNTSSSKYLSPSQYRNKLKVNKCK